MKAKRSMILGGLGLLILVAVSSLPAQSADKLTVWTRAYNQPQLKPIVDKWNSLGGVQVEAVYITDSEYVTKVSMAARGDEKPSRVESSNPGEFRSRMNRSHPEGE